MTNLVAVSRQLVYDASNRRRFLFWKEISYARNTFT
jgi:hypothetical protein